MVAMARADVATASTGRSTSRHVEVRCCSGRRRLRSRSHLVRQCGKPSEIIIVTQRAKHKKVSNQTKKLKDERLARNNYYAKKLMSGLRTSCKKLPFRAMLRQVNDPKSCVVLRSTKQKAAVEGKRAKQTRNMQSTIVI